MEISNKEKQSSESILVEVDKLRELHRNPEELILAMGDHIRKHGWSVPNRRDPRSILESRFTPAQEAYEQGMVSCGSIASISSEMLRHLGYKVKLIHGEVPESVDHAWISVFQTDKNTWNQYDLTRLDGQVTPGHRVKLECDSWEDIREQIEEDHRTLLERQQKLHKDPLV